VTDVDIEASGLLNGLSGTARAERAELIEWLLGQGITVEQIRGSYAPMLLPARQIMGDDGVYVSAREISERSGVDLELLGRMQRAVGLPRVDDIDAPVFMRADGDPAEHIGRFLALGIDPEQMLAAVRVLADGLSHAAEVMRSAATGAVVRPGATELELAQGSRAVVSAAAPLLGPMIQDMLSLQLRHALETEAVNASERAAGVPLPGARMVAVAFADLVGFTKLGEAVPPEDLEYLAHKLGDLARDAAIPPVRFIKTIGDAVMLVSTDVAAMLEAVLTLADSVADDDEIPPLRVGVAFGPAVSRAGDWFGGTVNLASRITSVARPGSVLVADAVRQEIGDVDRFRWSSAGARRLKGIRSEVKLIRVRRAGGK
jgi:adenylate cyclase